MGGQQCYTYYENVCENTNEAQCNMKGRNYCEQITLKDCRVVRERGSVILNEDVCRPALKRECFDYEKTVCDMVNGKEAKLISWENQRLEKVEDRVEEKCENVKRCNFTTEEVVEGRNIPRRVCENSTETQEICQNVPRTDYRVESRIGYQIQYVTDCQYINQPACSLNACGPQGCMNGGSVCSTSDYNTTTMCPQAAAGANGPVSPCQQVRVPVCYGNLGSCSSPNQQCCLNSQQRVCQQIPQRIPVQRNVTVPYMRYERECRNVERTTPNCRTEYEFKNFTSSVRKCNEIVEQECFNLTIPEYVVKMEVKNESVAFSKMICEKKTEKAQFCQNVLSDIQCSPRPIRKPYVLNKVICDRSRSVQFCRTIPESECMNVPNQRCRVVPRQVCQPACSESPNCNRCDSFRAQGGFSSCNSGMCPNFYPQDSFFNSSADSGSGYNGGNFGGGYNGGDGSYGGGYNGGDGSYGGGYNGGDGSYGGGYNGGDGSYNGGGGYNGADYGGGYNGGDGYNNGGGYNGGGYNGGDYGGGYNGGDGYNGGGYNGGGYNGGNGYNDGSNGGGYNDGSYGGGYNGGDDVYGGGGYNPGLGAGVQEEAEVVKAATVQLSSSTPDNESSGIDQ